MDRFKAYIYIEENSEPGHNGIAVTKQGDCGKYIMSMEFIALIGISVTLISIGVALGGLILNTQRNLRVEMKAQREETRAEFKAVRVEIISLWERVAHLKGLLDGLREAITGRRVAEETGQYDPR